MNSTQLLSLAGALPSGPARDAALHESRVARLREDTIACTQCDLSKSTTPVPLSGPTKSPVLIVSETPEDGRAAGLLNSALLDAGMGRDQVVTAHRVSCRPDGNKFALAEKADAPARCRPLLDRAIDLTEPLVVVPLGNKSLSAFPDPTYTAEKAMTITRAVGKAWWYKSRLVVPNYHPAYVMRKPELKADFVGVLHKVKSWVDGVQALPRRPKDYLPEWELAEISKGRHPGLERVKMAQHFKSKGWVAVHSDVVDDRMVIVDPHARSVQVPEVWAKFPRYTLDEVVRLRGATVGQLEAIHLAKKEFDNQVEVWT